MVGARYLPRPARCLEAGFFPACTYIISTWYVRGEIQKRMTGFYVLSVMVAGFSSAMAGGISEMAGIADLGGWQWIFILLGIVTVLAGGCAFYFVQDFPDKNKFLDQEQTKFILARINKDRSDAEFDHWTMAKFWSYLFDIHLWSYALMFGAVCTTTYVSTFYDTSFATSLIVKHHKAFAYFLPIILVQGMGYTTLNAQLLTAPPYVFAAIYSFSLAWLSDKYMLRGPFLIFQAIFAIIGLALVCIPSCPSLRDLTSIITDCFPYRQWRTILGVFFGIAGYMQNNVTGHTKRAFASAIAIGGGGVGGIVASTVFRSKDAPGYRPGRT
ncbi:MFS substrate transporter [Salix suchowensis]|nr:MFS substrate transporter [Salix suchowensis]